MKALAPDYLQVSAGLSEGIPILVDPLHFSYRTQQNFLVILIMKHNWRSNPKVSWRYLCTLVKILRILRIIVLEGVLDGSPLNLLQ